MASPLAGFGLSFGQVVQAQTPGVSDEEIDNYAAAVLEIEQMRTTTFDAIANLMAPAPVPSIACNQEDSIRDLPDAVKDQVVEFCQTSVDLVESTGLTVSEFNQITANQADDPVLFDAIQAALVRLQTPSADPTEGPGSEDPEATTEES
ncbi:MAG: DUF4168 domain-containing protein [Leptolyngbyaceae cyanobacterium]